MSVTMYDRPYMVWSCVQRSRWPVEKPALRIWLPCNGYS